MRYTVWNIPRSAWTEHPELDRLVITEKVIAEFRKHYKPDPREAMFELSGRCPDRTAAGAFAPVSPNHAGVAQTLPTPTCPGRVAGDLPSDACGRVSPGCFFHVLVPVPGEIRPESLEGGFCCRALIGCVD